MRKLFYWISVLFFTVPNGQAAKPFETMEWTTKQGVHVIFYPAMDVPMLDINVGFAAGSAYDGATFGLSSLTTRLLNKGNKGLDANTIAEQLAETGAQYEAASSQDMVVLHLKTLTRPDAMNRARDLFAAIIAHPTFQEDSFIREKNQQLMAITQAQESPDDIANQTFYQVLYKDHPYAHPVSGNQEGVQKITVDDVRRFYQQYFVSNNAIVVLVGAIDKKTADLWVHRITNDLPKGEKASAIPAANAPSEEMDIEVQFPSSQTILRLGQMGITHHDPRYFPLIVGNYILGGGALVSNLSHELREKRGLTYGVYSQFLPMPGKGPFLISLSTKKSQAKTAIDITRETLSSFIKNGPTASEVTAAKQYLTGSFPLSLASNRSIADMLLKIAFYELPKDYLQTYVDKINLVTKDDIKKAYQDTILPHRLLQIAVGKVAHR